MANQRYRLVRLIFVSAVALLLCWTLVRGLASASPPRASAGAVVISQVYGGGGNGGAPFLNDFIEIFNHGSSPVSLTGWSVQYAAATGSAWSVTALPALTLPVGGYLLIQQASGGANGLPLPAPDVTGTSHLAASAGKVALVNVTATLNVTNPVGLPQVMDFVGYGADANAWEGSQPAPAPSAAASLIRNLFGCMDSDDNGADFAMNTPPLPRNSLTPAYDCSATPPILTSPVLIITFFYAGYVPDAGAQGDEAVELMNVSAGALDIGGWSIGDLAGNSAFPPSTTLAAGERVWVARRASDFRSSFGFAPQFELLDSELVVPDMLGSSPPAFTDSGDDIVLKDAAGGYRDVVVYGTGSTLITGWIGAALQPYNVFPMNDPHQVIYRKLDERTGYPLGDTHRERDWSVSRTCALTLYGPVRDCDLSGKKPMAPGWRTGIIAPANQPTDDWATVKLTESAQLSVLVGPDHLFEQYLAAINSAQHSIVIEGYTLHNPDIVAALSARASAGVSLTILLEGEPCCEDSDVIQYNLWAAQQISNVVGASRVWFMANANTGTPHYDRYNNQHAKFTLIDAGQPTQRLLAGTENLTCSSMPSDNKQNGTAGNRGYYIKTDAPGLIAAYQRIFNLDLDRAQQDIVPYGNTPYVWDGVTLPPACGDGVAYTPLRRFPLNISGAFPFEVVQCPDNCLHGDESLIGMVRQAGTGDVLLVEQAYERMHWGLSSSSVAADPNPRLEAYIDAARRGAVVRILLDAKYDSPTSTVGNAATVSYVNAFSPSLNIEARLVDGSGGNGPAGNGIHAKLVMLNAPGRNSAWVHIGSINGSENSSKFNREMALQVQSTAVFCYLYDVFNGDWQFSGAANLDASGLRDDCPPYVPGPVLDRTIHLPLIGREN